MSISSLPSFTEDESRDFIHARNVSIDALRKPRMIHKRSLNEDFIQISFLYQSLFDSISNDDSKNSNDLMDLNDSKDSNDSIDYCYLIFRITIEL